MWDDALVEGGGDWHRDASTVRALRRILELEGAAPLWPMPEKNRAELAAVLAAARERLRRRLLLAEGLDPDTGRLRA